ncbi:alpha-amylase family protein [Nakamurella sp. PAMC28650]|uniref:alpha-amylase n=1 Tax=Nakamurella sp. PAMC28650 TaxID=2762325 RepID=UPI00164E7353|nr:alpha-amylase family protein [Nakamurella sp. PAMC28650]QNK81890.1 alpha-amylase family protein [Nakamurella sp. PAMC28650]
MLDTRSSAGGQRPGRAKWGRSGGGRARWGRARWGRAARINSGVAAIAAAVLAIALLPSPTTGGASTRTAVGNASTSTAVGGATSAGTAARATPAHPGRSLSKDVIANLFEWNWRSVTTECTHVLGPNGYGAVQVAPPQDSVKRTALGNGSNTVLHPWWEVYQPVDYQLNSRMGNEAQFKSMVATCRKAGVQVIVDAVINHMTGQGNVSYGGVSYTKYNYAGLYSPADFHSSPADCPVPPTAGNGDQNGSIADFNSYTQVFNCELVGLSDLRTSSNKVRDTLAAYLNKLLGYGVSGFRVDAAKHIGQTDLDAIESRLHRTVDGTRPYLALEVGTGSPGRISPFAFQAQGSLLGFDFASQIQSAFRSYTSAPGGNIGDLKVFGEQSGLLPSNRSLAFVENHDTERNNSTLNYKSDANTVATEFMLAYGYGRPAVYSSFAWTTTDDGPPSDANGMVTDTDCTNGWVCVDRFTGVADLVGWHNYAGSAEVANWWDDGNNLAAFSRGDRAWIAINNETAARTVTVETGLPAGRYCDVIHGARQGHACSGPVVTVGSHGRATVTVPAKDSVAIYALSRI